MLISVVDLALVGLSAIAVITFWEQYQHKEQLRMLKETLHDLVRKHNSLSDAYVNLGDQIEDEIDELHDEITEIKGALES
jgi:DnaJ-domain-containing protein 1